MRRAISALAVVLAGCVAPTETSVPGPSGQAMKVTKCSGSPNGCFEKASSVCRGGSYQVLASHSNAGGLVADLVPGPVTWYSMTYQCGPSDGRVPDFPFRGSEYRPPATLHCNTFGNTFNCVRY